jgi:murein DD-endopeptidase MepM/ murein hydrolase activator NlpD
MIYPLLKWKTLKRGYSFRSPTFYSQNHLGLDIKAPTGTPIVAWQDLEIIKAFVGKEGGNTAWIKCPHNIRLFRIMHLFSAAKEGNYKEGQVIGHVGSTGSMSTGPHLHIDISKSGGLKLNDINNFEDPEAYFLAINQPPRNVIKINNLDDLKGLKEEYLVRIGGEIYTCLQKVANPDELKKLKPEQIVRIGKTIYRDLRR